MAAQIGRDDPPAGEPLLGQPAEPPAVARQPVETDGGRAGRIAELVDVQTHVSTSFPNCAPEIMRSTAAAASASGRTESTTGRHAAVVDHREQPGEVLGAPHHRAEQRMLAGVERANVERDISPAGGTEHDDPAAPAAQRVERLLPRGADRVDHDVRAAELLDRPWPVGRGRVVDAGLGAELARPRDLVVRRRCDEHARPSLRGELDREGRDARASSQHEHRLAGL